MNTNERNSNQSTDLQTIYRRHRESVALGNTQAARYVRSVANDLRTQSTASNNGTRQQGSK